MLYQRCPRTEGDQSCHRHKGHPSPVGRCSIITHRPWTSWMARAAASGGVMDDLLAGDSFVIVWGDDSTTSVRTPRQAALEWLDGQTRDEVARALDERDGALDLVVLRSLVYAGHPYLAAPEGEPCPARWTVAGAVGKPVLLITMTLDDLTELALEAEIWTTQ